jgi:hypothetical protein
MKYICLFASALLLTSQAAFAADNATTKTSSGSGALALAALVGDHSPALSRKEKHVLRAFLDGKSKVRFPAKKTITVSADSVSCSAGNVDLTAHSCNLAFGKKTVTFHGRRAHELYATLIENGVPGDGAAGTIYEAVSKLSCTIDPTEIESKDGGGASCQFAPGA